MADKNDSKTEESQQPEEQQVEVVEEVMQVKKVTAVHNIIVGPVQACPDGYGMDALGELRPMF